MVDSFKNIVLFGAGGSLGTVVLQSLIEEGFHVTVLSRFSSSSVYPKGIKVARTDFSPQSLDSILQNQHAVVSTVTHMALAEQDKVIEASVAAGVKRFIPSEFGGNTANDRLLEAAPFTLFKRDAVDKLRKNEGLGPGKNFSWTAIITGPFLEWAIKTDFMGLDLRTKTATIFDDGAQHFATTTLKTAAAFVAASLKTPEESKNRYLYVRSARVTQTTLLEALKRQGGEEWGIKSASASELQTTGLQRIAAGDLLGHLDLIKAAFFTKSVGCDYAGNNAEFGIEGDRDVYELVKEVLLEDLRISV